MSTTVLRRGSAGFRFIQLRWNLVVIAVLLVVSNNAVALEIETGNEDISLNFDNTFRYSYGYRVQDPDSTILNSPNFDDGDRNFSKGTVMNRLDLLSELSLVYKKDYGIKVSGAGWYDQRYDNSLDNKNLASSNYFNNGVRSLGLPNETRARSGGPNGELLDAFVMAKFNIAEMPVYLKVGRSISYWGEGLLNPIHSISYSQFPIDFGKALTLPGVEVKELFRPLNNVTVTANISDTLTVSGQYFLQWEPYVYPGSGSFMGAFDFFHRGASSINLGPGFNIPAGESIEPIQARDMGLSLRWKPEWLTGTLGLYYRNFSDKQPQMGLLMNGAVPEKLMFSYASGINLYGASLARNFGPIAVGAEVSYRDNMPLNSGIGIAASSALLPQRGGTFGARGNTVHALINGMYLFSKTALWDLAVAMGEIDYNHLASVTSNSALYSGNAPDSPSNALSKSTRNYVEGTVAFTPTWYAVIPGVDLSMPLTITSGLSGNSAVMNGGNQHAGSYGVGFSADIFAKYKADIKYVGYFGPMNEAPDGSIQDASGSAYFKDRGTLSFTLKTTF